MDRSAGTRSSPDQLEQEVGLIREHLTDVVSELDYRRHELMDVKGQLKKRAPLLAMIAGGALMVAGGAVAVSMLRARARPKLKTRVVAIQGKPYESVWHRIATAAAGALAAVAVRAIAQQLITPVLEGGREPALPALPD